MTGSSVVVRVSPVRDRVTYKVDAKVIEFLVGVAAQSIEYVIDGPVLDCWFHPTDRPVQFSGDLVPVLGGGGPPVLVRTPSREREAYYADTGGLALVFAFEPAAASVTLEAFADGLSMMTLVRQALGRSKRLPAGARVEAYVGPRLP